MTAVIITTLSLLTNLPFAELQHVVGEACSFPIMSSNDNQVCLILINELATNNHLQQSNMTMSPCNYDEFTF